jgi:hypothetical protein
MMIGLSHGLNEGDSANAASALQKEGSLGPSAIKRFAPYKMTALRLTAIIVAALVTTIIAAVDAPTHALRLLFRHCM